MVIIGVMTGVPMEIIGVKGIVLGFCCSFYSVGYRNGPIVLYIQPPHECFSGYNPTRRGPLAIFTTVEGLII